MSLICQRSPCSRMVNHLGDLVQAIQHQGWFLRAPEGALDGIDYCPWCGTHLSEVRELPPIQRVKKAPQQAFAQTSAKTSPSSTSSRPPVPFSQPQRLSRSANGDSAASMAVKTAADITSQSPIKLVSRAPESLNNKISTQEALNKNKTAALSVVSSLASSPHQSLAAPSLLSFPPPPQAGLQPNKDKRIWGRKKNH